MYPKNIGVVSEYRYGTNILLIDFIGVPSADCKEGINRRNIMKSKYEEPVCFRGHE